MPRKQKRETVTAANVDRQLLDWQAARLAEAQAFLLSGEPCARAEEWPEAIEGVLNLLANLRPTTTPAPPPVEYIEWHVIDTASGEQIDRVDEPDLAFTHRAVTAGTAHVIEATIHAHIVSTRHVTEDEP